MAAPLLLLTQIPVLLSHYIHHKIWGEITYPSIHSDDYTQNFGPAFEIKMEVHIIRLRWNALVNVKNTCENIENTLPYLNSLRPHICVSKLAIIGPHNGLSPDRRQAIIWTNAGLLLIGPLGTNFSEILIEILTFSFKKMRLKVSSAKRRPFCLGLNGPWEMW